MSGFENDYAAVLETITPGLNTFAEKQAVPGDEWWETVARAATAVVMTDYQRQLLQVQIDRAKQGLPPLPMDQYGVGVSVGVAPSAQQSGAYLLLGIGALMILAKMLR